MQDRSEKYVYISYTIGNTCADKTALARTHCNYPRNQQGYTHKTVPPLCSSLITFSLSLRSSTLHPSPSGRAVIIHIPRVKFLSAKPSFLFFSFFFFFFSFFWFHFVTEHVHFARKEFGFFWRREGWRSGRGFLRETARAFRVPYRWPVFAFRRNYD